MKALQGAALVAVILAALAIAVPAVTDYLKDRAFVRLYDERERLRQQYEECHATQSDAVDRECGDPPIPSRGEKKEFDQWKICMHALVAECEEQDHEYSEATRRLEAAKERRDERGNKR